MKRKKSSPARTASAATNPDRCGSMSYVDAWMINLSLEVSVACEKFWEKTPERRAIEAKRKRSGFNFMAEK